MVKPTPISASTISSGAKCVEPANPSELLEAAKDESPGFFSTYTQRSLSDNLTAKLPPALRQPSQNLPYIDYENLEGYKLPGLKVISHKRESETRLSLERGTRATAAGLGSLVSLGATLGLFYSGAKTISAVSNGGDQDDANQASANSFGIAAIAGLGNSLAQENVNWGIGSAGMGFLGKYLDTPLGLSLFSIFDGINAIGMGQVKLRDQKNVIAMQNSIFDTPSLEKFKFLKQYEYAIRNFFQKLSSPRGWKQIATSEPYDLYYAAGGGLLTGGMALGVTSLFSKWMSESVKSLLYIPYSLTSFLNLWALGKDGLVTKERVNTYNDVKPIEKKTTIIEGWAKIVASPVIALNYAMLGLKGFGIDVFGSGECVAKSLRQFGVGIAYIGFAAQSGVKLLNPDQWGPKVKNIVEVILNPQTVTEYLMSLIKNANGKGENAEGKKDYSSISDYFYPRLMSDEFAVVFDKVLKTSRFKQLNDRHLTGLPSEMAPDRDKLKRGPHSIRAGTLACNVVDAAVNNNPQYSYLFNPAVRLGIKITSLLHDNGHADLPRCHLAETAFPMAKDANDHLSIQGLAPGSELANAITAGCIEQYGEKEGKDIAEKAINYAIAILGHNSIEVEAVNPQTGKPEKKIIDYRYKQLTDMADYMRSKGSDYPVSFNLAAWDKEQYEHYADQIAVFEDNDGKVKFGFTEEGAITTFKHLYYRLLFNAFLNSHPVTLAVEAAYKTGARQTNATLDEVYKMSDEELDTRASQSVRQVHAKSRQVIRNVLGGSKAYAGYGPKDTIYVVVNDGAGKQQAYEFMDYFHNILRTKNPDVYNTMKHMVDVVSNPTLLEVILNIDPGYKDDSLKTSEPNTEEPHVLPFEQPQQLKRTG